MHNLKGTGNQKQESTVNIIINIIMKTSKIDCNVYVGRTATSNYHIICFADILTDEKDDSKN